MFVSYDGNLLNNNYEIVRKDFQRNYLTIDNGSQLRATLRAGEFCSVGGYRLAFICSDGGVLSFDSVRDNLYNVIDSIRRDINDGWRVVGCFMVDGHDETIYCDHSNEKLN